jgi:hypothetical protein
MRRHTWIGWLIATLSGLTAWDAGAQTGYRYVKLWNLSPNALDAELILNDDGDLAVLESNPGSQALYFVARGGYSKQIALTGVFGPVTSLRVRGLSEGETVLYGADYFPTEPVSRAIRTWNRQSVPLEIGTAPIGNADFLDPMPDQNSAGLVSFWARNGSGGYDVVRYGTNGLSWLGACGSTTRTAMSPSHWVFADCAATPNAASRPIYRFGSGAPSVFVNEASFSVPVGEEYRPWSARPSGEILFERLTGGAAGYYSMDASGVPEYRGDFEYHDLEQNALDQLLLVPFFGESIYVFPAASVTVVDATTQISGATVVATGAFASLNDRGQVAFTAALSDGSAGVFLASPEACDADLDGWCDANDNCPAFADPSQFDADGDGIGDRCDNCPFAVNPDQLDTNGDGRGNACAACNPPGGPLPICGTLGSNGGTSNYVVGPFSIASVPVRPSLFVRTTSLTPGMTADARVSECSGGTPSAFPTISYYDGDGAVGVPLFWTYYRAPDRVGASCTVEFRATGATGSFSYLIEAATSTPTGGLSGYEGSGGPIFGQAMMPGNIPSFYDEATNHRFLFAGTGGANFGTCQFNPDPPVGDNPEVIYSGASGPGFDCCTFQFDGVDGVPSSVGQLVFNLNGAPPPPDPDGDGYLTPCDSCAYKTNVDQADRGRVGSTVADGIGDACQCTELTNDGFVNATDVTRLRQHLSNALPLPPTERARCSAIGGATDCTVRTLAVLRRALATPPRGPGVQQTCTAALPP